MAKKRSKFKVVNRKLGREKAWGQCWHGENLIEIDPRQPENEYFSTIIHECLHLCFDDKNLTEEEILAAEKLIFNTLWSHGYRKTK